MPTARLSSPTASTCGLKNVPERMVIAYLLIAAVIVIGVVWGYIIRNSRRRRRRGNSYFLHERDRPSDDRVEPAKPQPDDE